MTNTKDDSQGPWDIEVINLKQSIEPLVRGTFRNGSADIDEHLFDKFIY